MSAMSGIIAPMLGKYASIKIQSLNLKIEGLPFPIETNRTGDSSHSKEYSKQIVIKVRDFETLKQKAIADINLGVLEGYMDNLWDCDDFEELVYRFLKSKSKSTPSLHRGLQKIGNFFMFNMMNCQSSSIGSKELADAHYDLGESNETFIS